MAKRISVIGRILALLCMLPLLLAACVKEPPAPDPEPSWPEPPPYSATIEYGEPDEIQDWGFFEAYIRFPQAGGPFDKEIRQWAETAFQNAKAEVESLRAADPGATGEINIHFDSYLMDGRFAGVVESGMFSTSQLAHPADIVRVFNLDLSRGVFLEPSDILDLSKADGVLPALREKILAEYPGMEGLLGDMDESWLGCLAVSRDGVIVILERAAFLPGYLGTLKIALSRSELGSALLLGAQPEPDPAEPPPQQTLPPSIPLQPGELDPSRPMVALTFDDGPSKYTARMLDILEQCGGRATFCTVGNLVNTRKDTVLRASNLGCEVIGHSWDHKNLAKLTQDEVEKQILDTSNTIEAITGAAPCMYRPPYGAVDGKVKDASRALGFAIINWSVDPEDWKSKDADAVYSAVMGHVSDKAIVLSHDLYGTTVDAYARIIPELISQGYQLVTVSELLSCTHDTLEAGNVYYSGK